MTSISAYRTAPDSKRDSSTLSPIQACQIFLPGSREGFESIRKLGQRHLLPFRQSVPNEPCRIFVRAECHHQRRRDGGLYQCRLPPADRCARFNAIPNLAADALLTALPVASFGFLGSNPGAITIQGTQFSVTEGQGISLVGGKVTIQSGTPDGGISTSSTSAPNGKIQLASAASPGEFDAATLQALPRE